MGAASLEDAEVQAWLAFDVAPSEVGATLQAAIKAKTVERVVVAATGPVPDDQLKVVEGEDIDWSVVSFDVAALADEEVVEEKSEEEKKAEAIDRAKEYEELFAESR